MHRVLQSSAIPTDVAIAHIKMALASNKKTVTLCFAAATTAATVKEHLEGAGFDVALLRKPVHTLRIDLVPRPRWR